MSTTQSQSQRRQSPTVKIRNPISGGVQYMTRKRAEQRERRGLGKIDPITNEFVFNGQHRGIAVGKCHKVIVDHWTGKDARPGMPVLPPSPEVLARQTSRFRSAAEVMQSRVAREHAELAGVR